MNKLLINCSFQQMTMVYFEMPVIHIARMLFQQPETWVLKKTSSQKYRGWLFHELNTQKFRIIGSQK